MGKRLPREGEIADGDVLACDDEDRLALTGHVGKAQASFPDTFNGEIVGTPNRAVVIAARHGFDLDGVAGAHDARSPARRLERFVWSNAVDRRKSAAGRERSQARNQANETPKVPPLPAPIS